MVGLAGAGAPGMLHALPAKFPVAVVLLDAALHAVAVRDDGPSLVEEGVLAAHERSAPLADSLEECYTLNVAYWPDMSDVGQGRTHEDSPDLCLARCRKTKGCVRYSWHFWNGGCHLSDHRGKREVKKDVISGPSACMMCSMPGEFEPLNMQGQGRTVAKTQADCKERCVETPGCASWSWYTDKGCHIQAADAGNKLKMERWVVSGYKTCTDCFNAQIVYSPNMAGQNGTVEDSPQKCLGRCRATAGCESYSWQVVSGECNLQDGEAKSFTAMGGGVVSGPRECLPRTKPNTAFEPVMPNGELQANSQESCLLLCAQNGQCERFTWHEDGRCQLHGASAKAKPSLGATAGPVQPWPR